MSGMISPRNESAERVLTDYARPLEQGRRTLLEQRKRGEIGWLDLPMDKAMIKRVQKVVAKTKKFQTLLVLGIGGSDLGARAILQALGQGSKKSVRFAGANTDPDELEAVLKDIIWKKTVVNIISKSGDTVEPMSAFLVVRERLRKAVGKKFAQQIVATTDAKKGTLHDLAEEEGYHQLIVPQNVGGRFSVLSDVGLFPAAFAGIAIKEMLAGAAEQVRVFEKDPVDFQPAAQYAGLHADWFQRHRANVWVLMPYSAHLELFGRWYRQLIAESLGKKKNRNALTIEIGPTPVAALGATDQHSQIQLYMEGPHDKVITFIEIEKFRSRLRVSPLVGEVLHERRGGSHISVQTLERFATLVNVPFEELIHAERKATAEALTSVKRPNATITLPKLDAYHLGALFQMFMIATAYLGELFNIDPYNQPGVEEGKKRFKMWLENRG